MTIHHATPLKWKVDWNNLRPQDKFLMWFPLLGAQRRIHADILRQLKTRSVQDFQAWEDLGPEICNAARSTINILIENLGWPKTAIFLPEDPGDIPFWDKNGDLAMVEAILAVERHFTVTLPEDFWTSLSKITFGEVIAKLVYTRQRKQGGSEEAH